MLQKSLENLANLLVKERHLTVILTDNNTSSTDGFRILLGLHPALRTSEPDSVYRYLTAMLYHEVGHVLYSSFQAYHDATLYLLSKFKLNDPVVAKKIEHLIRLIFNAFEDVRIERVMSQDYPLAKDYFYDLNDQLFTMPKKSLREHEVVLDDLLVNAFLGINQQRSFSLSKDTRILMKRLKKRIPEIVSMDSTKACLDLLIVELTPYRHVIMKWATAVKLEEINLEPDFVTIPVYESVNASKRRKQIYNNPKEALIRRNAELISNNILNNVDIQDCSEEPSSLNFNLLSDSLQFRAHIKHALEINQKQNIMATSGRLNPNKLYKLMVLRTDLFSRQVRVSKEVAFSILVDVSGSMSGEKLKKACEIAAVMEVGLEHVSPLEIAAYSTREINACHYIIKSYSQKTNGKSRIWGFYQTGNYEKGGNIEDENLKIAGAHLLKYPKHRKYLIILCDAVPSVKGIEERTKTVVSHLKSKGVTVVALLIGHLNEGPENLKRARAMYENVCQINTENSSQDWMLYMTQMLRRTCF